MINIVLINFHTNMNSQHTTLYYLEERSVFSLIIFIIDDELY